MNRTQWARHPKAHNFLSSVYWPSVLIWGQGTSDEDAVKKSAKLILRLQLQTPQRLLQTPTFAANQVAAPESA